MSKYQFDSSLKNFFDTRDECWGCKDVDSQFVYANELYCTTIGLTHPSECVGLTDFDFPSNTVAKAPNFIAQDQFVMQERKTIKVLDIHRYYDNQVRAHIYTKSPWVDRGAVIGTIFCGEEVNRNNFTRLCAMFANQDELSRPWHVIASHILVGDQVTLSEQEKVIVYFLAYGRTRHDIARVLQLKLAVLDDFLCKLQFKFGVQSKAQLIEAVIQQGFVNELPLALLPNSLSETISQ
jgi:DNA-binding CsgD family transcriptional regulator